MKNPLLNLIIISLIFVPLLTIGQIDPSTTSKTQYLYENLKEIGFGDQILFGQEFANTYNTTGLSSDPWQSECRDASGSHPAVIGSDFLYYLKDGGVDYNTHKTGVQKAYLDFGTGAVITFDYHFRGPGHKPGQNYGTPDFYYTDQNNTQQMVTGNRYLAHDIVYDHQWGWYTDDNDGDPRKIDGKTPREWFYDELQEVENIINDLQVWKNGQWEKIPIVFRLYHEMNGGWFWWGKDALAFSEADYQTLFRMTVDYFTPRVDNVLFCWSPDMFYTQASYGRDKGSDFYPGNSYVDVLGLDAYEIGDSYYSYATFRNEIRAVSDYAYNNQKVAALTETGYRSNVGEINQNTYSWAIDWASGSYWQDRVYDALYNDPLGRAHKVAWALTWINYQYAPNPYVPGPNTASWSTSKFSDFKNQSNIVFASEMSTNNIDMYASSGSRSNDEAPSVEDVASIETWPNPATDFLQIAFPSTKSLNLKLIDMKGALVLNKHWEDLAFNNTSQVKIDVTSINQGTYIYQIQTDQGAKTGKLKIE